MRFVAPDTNFILHFKPISEVKGIDIGVTGEFTWLVVGQVMQELDIRKGTGDKKLRTRAREAARAFERADTGAEPFAGSEAFEVHFRTRDFDFEGNGLLRNEGDHKVIADILDFKVSHPSDEVILLSDDASARMRARKHGIPTLEAPALLGRPEIEDARDARIRELEQENRTLSESQPKLDLAFTDESREMQATVASYNKEAFEDLMRRATLPERDEPTGPFSQQSWSFTVNPFLRPNPDYDKQLAAHGAKFREYFLKSWIQKFRTVEISPTIYSQNGVLASVVNVHIDIKTIAEVLSEPPEEVKRPEKPRRILDAFNPYGASPSLSSYRLSIPELETFNPYRPTVEQDEESVVVTYAMMHVAQEAAIHLDPFYLVFDHDVVPSTAIELSYEIRAKNMNGVVRGRLLIRLLAAEKKISARYLMDAEA